MLSLTQGLDLFQAVGMGREQVPQQMFYSRRIGLDAPILGAAKAVGSAGGAVRVGVVDAVVTGTGQPAGASEDRPDGRASWSALQPFRLAPASAYPLTAPVSKNFLAAVARWDAAPRTTFGAQLASAMPLRIPCTPSENDVFDDQRRGECDARGGNALAVDFNTSSADGAWYAYGQGAASRIEGGPSERTLPDGVVLRPGDTGAGGYVRAGRRAGEGLRFSVGWSYASPRLDLNAAGFQRTQNEQEGRARVEWAWPRGLGPLHDLVLYVSGRESFTTDRRGLARGAALATGFEGTLKQSYLGTDCELAWTDPQNDVREVEESGIPLRRPGSLSLTCDVSSDAARPVSADVGGYVSRTVAAPALEGAWSAGGFAAASARPHPRLETRIEVSLDHPT